MPDLQTKCQNHFLSRFVNWEAEGKNLRLSLLNQSAVQGKRVKGAGKAILHVLLHVYAVGGRSAVVIAARAPSIAAGCCGVGGVAVGSCAGGDGISDLGGRDCVAVGLGSTVVCGLLCGDADGKGGGLIITLLVGHDELMYVKRLVCVD